MFLLLAGVITLHQVYATLIEKIEHWPLRRFLLRFIEVIGRCLVAPFVIIYFAQSIHFADTELENAVTYTAVALTSVLFLREMTGLRASFREACRLLVEKVNNPLLLVKDVSLAEVIVLNHTAFHQWSFSKERIILELENHGHIAIDTKYLKPTLQLRNAGTLSQLLRSGGGGGGRGSNSNSMGNNVNNIEMMSFSSSVPSNSNINTSSSMNVQESLPLPTGITSYYTNPMTNYYSSNTNNINKDAPKSAREAFHHQNNNTTSIDSDDEQ